MTEEIRFPSDSAEAFGLLAKEVRRQTEVGEFWGPNGALALQVALVNAGLESDKLYCRKNYWPQRISTYYAAYVDARKWSEITGNPFWYFRQKWTLQRAFWLSEAYSSQYTSEHAMSAEELDVRAAILIAVGRRTQAQHCIKLGLQHPNVSEETRASLLERQKLVEAI